MRSRSHALARTLWLDSAAIIDSRSQSSGRQPATIAGAIIAHFVCEHMAWHFALAGWRGRRCGHLGQAGRAYVRLCDRDNCSHNHIRASARACVLDAERLARGNLVQSCAGRCYRISTPNYRQSSRVLGMRSPINNLLYFNRSNASVCLCVCVNLYVCFCVCRVTVSTATAVPPWEIRLARATGKNRQSMCRTYGALFAHARDSCAKFCEPRASERLRQCDCAGRNARDVGGDGNAVGTGETMLHFIVHYLYNKTHVGRQQQQ